MGKVTKDTLSYLEGFVTLDEQSFPIDWFRHCTTVALQRERRVGAERQMGSGGPARLVDDYSAPTTWKSWLRKTWWGQLTPMEWTLYSPLLSSTTRSTMPPG